VQDLNDNYQFLYPFGWQEVTITGADVVYKDVVEPLESVSVTITPTDKKDVTEFGEIADVSDRPVWGGGVSGGGGRVQSRVW
jgi:photosystem II oxygen-evolving enhancer protein 2